MDIFQAIILGIIQGLTEFIPISSSAHLIIVPWLFGWQDPGLAFDVALHLGTLVALLKSGNAVVLRVAVARAILMGLAVGIVTVPSGPNWM